MQTATGREASTSSGNWHRLGAVDDFTGPGPFATSAGTLDLVILRSTAGWRAYDGLCPHRGALLGEGELEDGVLICRNHRWKFRSDTGERVGGRQCLKAYAVREDDGALWVDLAPSAATQDPGSELVSIRSLPSAPGAWPVLGHTFKIDIPKMHRQLVDWAEDRGSMYRIKIGPVSGVVVLEPEPIQQLLRNRPDALTRSAPLEPVFRELGVHGVFSSEGQEWRPQRRLAMRALAHRRLSSLFPTLEKVTERLIRRWREHAANGTDVDIQDDFMRYTVDVTTTLAFGRDMNTLEGSDGEIIQRHLELIFPVLMKRLTAPFPYWRFFKLPKDRKVEQALAAVKSWIHEVIAETRAELESHPERAENPTNFLESMLSARDVDGELLSEDLVIGNALTMLLAGEDTTANSLAWAVHELSDCPEAVMELRNEVDQRLGDVAFPQSIGDADSLRYADAITQETLRLRSVAPLIILTAKKNVVVDRVDVPAGTTLFCVTDAAGRDEEYITDAGAFRPGRWLDGSVDAYKQAGHVPFGSGPRICPGRSLALLEMRMVLAALYKNFVVERCGDRSDVRERFNFTMGPEGLRVRLRERGADGHE